MIIKGKLIKLKRETKEYNGRKNDKEKLYITLAEVELDNDQMRQLQEAFKDSGKKFTPDWINEFEGYVNLATEFEIPARLFPDSTEVESIEASVKEGYKWMGADCRVSIRLKEGAIYPSAIVFDSEGTAINAFAEFDE